MHTFVIRANTNRNKFYDVELLQGSEVGRTG